MGLLTDEERQNIMNITKLREAPYLAEQCAHWFSSKWGIPEEAYFDSIEECIQGDSNVPQWYVILDEDNKPIAGAGVIENDFHDRKDLSPNLCALYVEEPYRNRGIAKQILDFIRKDLGTMGLEKLYLITDHTTFYEKCGWQFLTMVNGDEGNSERMYAAERL